MTGMGRKRCVGRGAKGQRHSLPRTPVVSQPTSDRFWEAFMASKLMGRFGNRMADWGRFRFGEYWKGNVRKLPRRASSDRRSLELDAVRSAG
jgi:hypothetical protein